MAHPRVTVILLVALVSLASASGADVDKHRPVSKVITLLKDMVVQLQKEGEEDKKVFDSFGCWCETGLKGKTVAIAEGTSKITQLTDTLGALAGQAARLNTEIKTLAGEVAANTEALESATAMREKELSEFTAGEKSAMASIATMKGAIDTLSKHNSAAFLQQSESARDEVLMRLSASVHEEVRRHPKLVPAAQQKLLDAFLEAPDDFLQGGRPQGIFLQQGAGYNPAYAPQSGQIFGVLGAMKENFEKNLAAAQKEESTNQADYEGLKTAKKEEILAGNNLVDSKTAELASTETSHAENDLDLKDAERTLAADQEFLSTLKEKCAVIDQEYAQRTATRQQESTAVSKALAYLSSDEAADLFARTLNPSDVAFVQLATVRRLGRSAIPIGSEVAGSEQAAAEDAGAAEPAAMGLEQAAAADKQEQAFEQVTESVEEMVTRLVTEKEDEIKLKDFCIDSISKNERDTDEKKRAKADYEAAIETHALKIATLAKEIEVLHTKIADARVALKRAGEDREAANKDFQLTVADQRATRKLLTGALSILKGFYGKEAALAQTRHRRAGAPAGPPPPPDFQAYAHSAASGGVMGQPEQIIKDASAMEAEALKGEEESQVAYETLVAETNASVVAMQEAIVKKTSWKAQETQDKTQKEVDLKTVDIELEELAQASLDFHKRCDYTLANFDSRQSSRDDEIHSLKESIALLNGQKFHGNAPKDATLPPPR